MLLSHKRFYVSAGLSAVLALGALGIVGCFSTTTVSTTTSDGTTETTETTTTTSDENGTTTTTTKETKSEDTSLADATFYTIDAIGLRYDLPKDFTFTEANTDIDIDDENAFAFKAQDATGNSANLQVLSTTEAIDVASKEFLDSQISVAKEVLSDGSFKVVETATGIYEISDTVALPYTNVVSESDDGDVLISRQVFATDPDDNLIVLTFTGTNDEVVDSMMKGLSA